MLPISPLSTAVALPNPLCATRKRSHLLQVIGGQPALSSKRPARVRWQERKGTFDLRRHGDEVEFGFAMSGLPPDAHPERAGGSSKRSRQRGAGRDDRLTAAGRIPRKGVIRAARKTTVPRRAANGRCGGRPNPDLACQRWRRKAGSGPDRGLAAMLLQGSGCSQAEARTRTVGAER